MRNPQSPRMDATLRFWVDCEVEHERVNGGTCKAIRQIAAVLQRFEANGWAMRHLDHQGRIAWRASPRMLTVLADLEREAEDDLPDVW